MSRVVLYTIADNGWVVPIRRAYRKARHRKKMSRYHDWPGFQKNRTKSNNRYTKDELLDYFKNEIQQEDDFTSKVQTAIAADLLIRAIFEEANQSDLMRRSKHEHLERFEGWRSCISTNGNKTVQSEMQR